MPGGGPSSVVVVADDAHDSRLLYDVNGLPNCHKRPINHKQISTNNQKRDRKKTCTTTEKKEDENGKFHF